MQPWQIQKQRQTLFETDFSIKSLLMKLFLQLLRPHLPLTVAESSHNHPHRPNIVYNIV